MNRNQRRSSSKSSQQWEVQQVGTELRYLTTEDGSAFVVARQSANAFCWEEPKGHSPEAANPGEQPVSDREVLLRKLSVLRRAYRSSTSPIYRLLAGD